MSYIVGIDGGGSKTLGYIGNEHGEILYKYTSSGSNYHSVGITKTKSALSEVLEYLCNASGIGIADIEVISLGMAGCGRENDKKIIKDLLSEIGIRNEIIINSDAFTSMVGALGNQKGVVTICGTGSICMGMDASGAVVRAGGWGHLISDEGSGYFIGQSCFKAIMQSYDGIGEQTALTPMVLDFLGLESEEDIVSYLYHESRRKEDIASIAPIVFRCAAQDDDVSNIIIADAIGYLVELTKKVIEKINTDDCKMLVAVDGGIFNNVSVMRKLFTDTLVSIYDDIEITNPIYDGGIGAYIIGMQQLGKYDKRSNITINIGSGI